MKILITGATGTLGSALMKSLQNNHDCIGVYRSKINPHISPLYPCSLNQRDQVEQLCNTHNPDLIIHCAAMTNVDNCQSQPSQAIQDNVLATLNLAKWSGENKVKMYFISSDQIFDGLSENAYLENSHPHPLNWYARTKVWAEQSLLELNPLATSFRTNFFSMDQSFFAWAMRSLLTQNSFFAFTDIQFNPLYIQDLILILKQLFTQDLPSTLNLCSKKGMTKADFIFELARLFDLDTSKVKRSVSSGHQSVSRPSNMLLDSHLLSQYIPSVPTTLKGLQHLKKDLRQKLIAAKIDLKTYYL